MEQRGGDPSAGARLKVMKFGHDVRRHLTWNGRKQLGDQTNGDEGQNLLAVSRLTGEKHESMVVQYRILSISRYIDTKLEKNH